MKGSVYSKILKQEFCLLGEFFSQVSDFSSHTESFRRIV